MEEEPDKCQRVSVTKIEGGVFMPICYGWLVLNYFVMFTSPTFSFCSGLL